MNSWSRAIRKPEIENKIMRYKAETMMRKGNAITAQRPLTNDSTK